MNVATLVARAREVLDRALPLAAAWPAIAIAIVALVTTPHAPWRILGPLSTALIAGLLLRGLREVSGKPPSARENEGLRVFATHVLRAAVVLSALRLDWSAIAAAGARPWIIAGVAVIGGLLAFAALTRALGVRGSLAALVAIGTSVCGAAAIAAAAPRLGADEDDVTLAIALVSVLGAALAVVFVGVHAVTGLGGDTYALFTGGALHEVAHVVAAGAAVPASADLALLTKLARVAMLPLGLVLVGLSAAIPVGGQVAGRVRIPGLAIGFFVVSLIGSIPGWIPGAPAALLEGWALVRGWLLQLANVALAISMAAIGLRLAPRQLARTSGPTLGLAILGAGAVLTLVALAIALTR